METETLCPPLLSSLEKSSRRFETPCGDGVMVWRQWGAGRPLLLLHGGHGSWMHWARNIEYFAQSYSVWAPDLPGYGDSALPFQTAESCMFATPIAAGLRQLTGSVAANVIGFSLGGVIGANLSVAAPQLVRRLILVDAGGLDTPKGQFATTSIRGLTDPAAIRDAHRANLLALMLHQPGHVDDLAIEIQSTNVPRGRIIPDGYVMPDRLLKALQRASVAIDAVWGEFDRPHPNPALQRTVLAAFQPDLDFRIISGAGHWSMYEEADQFNRALGEMLNKHR